MWGYLSGAAVKALIWVVTWLEYNVPVMVPATIAAYFVGKHWGYKGVGLKLFMGFGVFCSVVGSPVVIHSFGLDGGIWGSTISSALAVFCYRMLKWAEAVIIKRLGIERRAGEME